MHEIALVLFKVFHIIDKVFILINMTVLHKVMDGVLHTIISDLKLYKTN